MLSDMFVTTALAACISDYFKPYLTLQCAWHEWLLPNLKTNGNTTNTQQDYNSFCVCLTEDGSLHENRNADDYLPFFKLNSALATAEIWHFSKAIC
jgi:hypothetical protein